MNRALWAAGGEIQSPLGLPVLPYLPPNPHILNPQKSPHSVFFLTFDLWPSSAGQRTSYSQGLALPGLPVALGQEQKQAQVTWLR